MSDKFSQSHVWVAASHRARSELKDLDDALEIFIEKLRNETAEEQEPVPKNREAAA